MQATRFGTRFPAIFFHVLAYFFGRLVGWSVGWFWVMALVISLPTKFGTSNLTFRVLVSLGLRRSLLSCNLDGVFLLN